MKKALITGITGQDGSYLAELLLEKGYDVHGIVRRVAMEDPQHRLLRLQPFKDRLHLHAASLESYASVFSVVDTVRPDECYHLAAQSFVSYSFDDEFSTLDINIHGTQYVLAALHRLKPDCRFYFAGSSEMFGKVHETPQRETTPFHPRSPYGISKCTGHYLTLNYREAYGMHASSGILFNHESPRRGYEFVSRKITSGVARIACGHNEKIRLGNLEAKRDWGFAGDYVRAMWLMLQQPKADDYVIATGETRSVRDLLDAAFACVGMKSEAHFETDPQFYRPAEVELLIGDATKAQRTLGWKPTVGFGKLVGMMVESDLARERERHP
jgi:GDPmannose 4,6-dehydratase